MIWAGKDLEREMGNTLQPKLSFLGKIMFIVVTDKLT